MAALDAGLEKISAEQRAKGKLHTAATAEAFSAWAMTQLAEVGSEIAAHFVECIETAGPSVLSNREVLAEYTATMKFGRDRLAAKLLKSIRNLGLPNPRDGTDGLTQMNQLVRYEPGESRLTSYFKLNLDAPRSASKSTWQPTTGHGRKPATAARRIWLSVLLILIAILAAGGFGVFPGMW